MANNEKNERNVQEKGDWSLQMEGNSNLFDFQSTSGFVGQLNAAAFAEFEASTDDEDGENENVAVAEPDPTYPQVNSAEAADGLSRLLRRYDQVAQHQEDLAAAAADHPANEEPEQDQRLPAGGPDRARGQREHRDRPVLGERKKN